MQIKDNSKDKRIKPFAHVLLGMVRQATKYKGFGESPFDTRPIILGSNKVANNGFSWALGGGLDIRVHRRIDIRVIQFDYNPVRTKDQTLLAVGGIRDFSNLTFFTPRFNQAAALNSIGIPGRTQHNFRVGFGIVFH